MSGIEKKDPLFLIHISDCHIGHANVDQTRFEFFNEEEGILTKMRQLIADMAEENIKISGLCIEGDFFDRVLSANSAQASLASQVMCAFVDLFILEHDAAVYIIRGTFSHDFNQLNIFKPFQFLYPDQFFVIDSVTEKVVNGYSVLFIPEEYMKNQDEFYIDYINDTKKYDTICGHGFFKHNCFNKNEVEKPMADMPIFDDIKLLSIARVIVFGHDHHSHIFKDRLGYNGSTSRLCHGEEEPKGFLVTLQGLSTDVYDEDYVIEFIENTLAPCYKTVMLNKITKFYGDFEKCVNVIKKQFSQVDFLKVKITQDVLTVNPAITELLREYFVTEKRIIIDSAVMQLKNGEIIDIEGIADEEGDSVLSSKYAFLFEKESPIDKKIYDFINLKHDNSSVVSNIDLEFIRDSILPN